jgi:hypothetical protein
MNGAIECLREFANRGVEVWREGDHLRYRGPRGAVSPSLRDLLRDYRDDIIQLFERGVIRFVPCPADGCGESLMLIAGAGYCKQRRISVYFADQVAC